jgi:hypothetical protein
MLHGADGFTSHPKEGVPRIFIAFKNNQFLSPGFEPVNPVSNVEYTSHYSADDDMYVLNFICVIYVLGRRQQRVTKTFYSFIIGSTRNCMCF